MTLIGVKTGVSIGDTDNNGGIYSEALCSRYRFIVCECRAYNGGYSKWMSVELCSCKWGYELMYKWGYIYIEKFKRKNKR